MKILVGCLVHLMCQLSTLKKAAAEWPGGETVVEALRLPFQAEPGESGYGPWLHSKDSTVLPNRISARLLPPVRITYLGERVGPALRNPEEGMPLMTVEDSHC
jgi:hypothetical protein